MKNVQCHLVNNADTFLKLAEYCPGLLVKAQLFQCRIDIFLFKIFACGKHFEQPLYLLETDSIQFALHFWCFLDVFFIFRRPEYVICILLTVFASVYNYEFLRLAHCCVCYRKVGHYTEVILMKLWRDDSALMSG